MNTKDEITERVGVHKFALMVLEKFNWLEREQPISDYGIDLQIEIVDDNKPTGMLYAIQIKSGQSYFTEITDNSIIYRGKIKHLDYWKDYSLPVILVLYNPSDELLYWSFVTENNAIKTKKAWKLEIPKTNILCEKSKEEIQSYYINENIFTLLKTEDISHALSRRISVRLLHKKEMSQLAIKQTIPQIIKRLKKSDYFRNELVESHHKNKLADSIWIFTYKNLPQYNHGLPYCTAVWNSPESKISTELSSYDEILDDNIRIKWSDNSIPVIPVLTC